MLADSFTFKYDLQFSVDSECIARTKQRYSLLISHYLVEAEWPSKKPIIHSIFPNTVIVPKPCDLVFQYTTTILWSTDTLLMNRIISWYFANNNILFCLSGAQYYNAWVSLLGTLLCIAVMFLISWWTALVTFFVVITLYLYVSYRKPGTVFLPV